MMTKTPTFSTKNQAFLKEVNWKTKHWKQDVPHRYDRPEKRDAVQLSFRPNIKSDNPMIRHGQTEKSLTKILKNVSANKK